jgi:uncharacterized protein (TIGR00299 family) protein
VRTLHFDCFSGISGDMTLAALIDLGVDADAIRRGLNSLGLPIKLTYKRVRRCGIDGTHVQIEAPVEDENRHLPEIEAIIDRGTLTLSQKDLAKRIFRRLGEAEAKVHGIPIEKVHFHEVGALDSIADIVGAAIGLDLLGVHHFSSRSVPTGVGTVKCAHGTMPIPAPATANLLAGAPLAPSTIKAELTTPTGAAILTSVVTEWVESPAMTIERIGYGAGTKDFPNDPNVLRVFLGSALRVPSSEFEDTVWVLETNLDDVPAEIIGYCFERLLAAGALDVFTIPIQMKKNRPGVMLSVLAPESLVSTLEEILFRETATFGIRRYPARRSKMAREICQVPTPWGPVKAKRGRRGELTVVTPEYEDCARVARERNIPLRDVFDAVRRAANGGSS